jgi:hypothetical protein
MLVFFFWFAIIWMFIALFADILRRDMSGWAKAGWILLLVLLPFLGALLYLIARPKAEVPADQAAIGGAWSQPDAPASRSADAIATAAALYDTGKITADEFERLKQKALS